MKPRVIMAVVPAFKRARGDGGGPATPDYLCVQCKKGESNYAMIPCGHICMCSDCTEQIEDGDIGDYPCPYCEEGITEIVRVIQVGVPVARATPPAAAAAVVGVPRDQGNNILTPAHCVPIVDNMPVEKKWTLVSVVGDSLQLAAYINRHNDIKSMDTRLRRLENNANNSEAWFLKHLKKSDKLTTIASRAARSTGMEALAHLFDTTAA